jgi:hypothetical protein
LADDTSVIELVDDGVTHRVRVALGDPQKRLQSGAGYPR